MIGQRRDAAAVGSVGSADLYQAWPLRLCRRTIVVAWRVTISPCAPMRSVASNGSGFSVSSFSVCSEPSGARPIRSVKVPPRSIQNYQRPGSMDDSVIIDTRLRQTAASRHSDVSSAERALNSVSL